MTLEKQVCSLELAKKLKELGVKHESLFYWKYSQGRGNDQVVPMERIIESEYFNYYQAYTVAELGEMLPRYIADADQPLSGVKGKQYHLIIESLGDDYSSDNKIDGWRIRYGGTKIKIDSEHKLNSAGIYYVSTEADARAKMLIYLLENKLITL